MQFPTELARGGKGRIHGTKKSPYCEQLGLKGNGTHTEADTNTQEKKGHKTISSMDHRSFLMDTWRLASIYCKNPCDVNVGCMMYSTILRLQVRSKYGQQMHINSRAGPLPNKFVFLNQDETQCWCPCRTYSQTEDPMTHLISNEKKIFLSYQISCIFFM